LRLQAEETRPHIERGLAPDAEATNIRTVLTCVRIGHVHCGHIEEKDASMTTAPDVTTLADPLKPAVFYILLALADEPAYGYAVMQAVRAQSAGTVPLRTGSFYRHLSKLIDDGLVAEAAGRPAGDDPRRGVYYRVTPRGLRVLARERARLAALVAAVDALRPASRRGTA
jgi:PadR family transcriptional regulator PadR